MGDILPFGFEFYGHDLKYTVSCYDFFNDRYWCQYENKYGKQYKWVASIWVKQCVAMNKK